MLNFQTAGPRDSDPIGTQSASHICPHVAALSFMMQCGLLHMTDAMPTHGSNGLHLAALAIREMSPIFPVFFSKIPRKRLIAPSDKNSLLDHLAL